MTKLTLKSSSRRLAFVALALYAILVNRPLPAQSQPTNLVTLAKSDFEVNAEGWLGTNGTGAETVLHLTGGATSNSVGYVNLTESAQDNKTSFFVAPAKFLGDRRAAYNGFLTFSLRQNKSANMDSPNRLVVLGSGTNFLSFDLVVAPGTNWEGYAVPINENSGWHYTISTNGFATSGQLATLDSFLQVLQSLDLLLIRGEFSGNNGDVDDLDDVLLLGQPSGPPTPNVSSTTYAGLTLVGAVGSTYRIEYRDALDATTNWLTLTNLVIPASPHLFIDTNSPPLSQRFYRAVLAP